MGQAIERMIAEHAGPPTDEEVEVTAEVEADRADTLADALDPILAWERNSVEFWLQVAQLVVLVLILREVQG